MTTDLKMFKCSTCHCVSPLYLYSCPPDWQLFVLWGKMANVGGFHKFLYYSIMSVVCFLHPVLLWHAIIPGTMLLVTAVFNFILSKKHNSQPPKRPQEIYSDHSICVTEGGGSDSRFSFLPVVVGRRGESLALNSVDTDLGLREQGESVRTVLDREQTDQRKRHWRDSICFRGREEPVEREMKEMDQYSEPEVDTTSDTKTNIGLYRTASKISDIYYIYYYWQNFNSAIKTGNRNT
uniref:Transmembrane protein 72 n=1 Tax=Gouania willdenowi TaxID=441366 RepID=A0A8C5H235_GOUWI